MSLASRPKPSVHRRKSQARHHRQSKPYLKTYWPYLPMLMIMGAGAAIDRSWSPQGLVSGAGAGVLPHASARVEVLTGSSATWLVSLVSLVAVLALGFFMIRNSLRFQRVLVRSEHFISEHPVLDIAAVFIFTAGFVLAR